MRLVLSLLTSLSIITVAVLAEAQNKPAAPAVAAVPTSAAPAFAPVAPPPAPAVVPSQPVIATLKDGSKIEMDSDGSVLMLNADGTKNPVPDGVLTLRDSTTFAVRGGKRVDD